MLHRTRCESVAQMPSKRWSAIQGLRAGRRWTTFSKINCIIICSRSVPTIVGESLGLLGVQMSAKQKGNKSPCIHGHMNAGAKLSSPRRLRNGFLCCEMSPSLKCASKKTHNHQLLWVQGRVASGTRSTLITYSFAFGAVHGPMLCFSSPFTEDRLTALMQ